MKRLLFILLLLPVLAHGQVITTVAGGGVGGFSGDGGSATAAELYLPGAIAFDYAGNIYFTDAGNNRVRKIDMNSGIISTIAGNGTSGYSGDNGPATAAALNGPSFIALDKAGNIYFTDFGNNRVRKVSTSNDITTYAGNGGTVYNGDGIPATSASFGDPMGIDVDTAGNVYFGDGTSRIRKVSKTGIISTVAGNGSFGFSGDGGPATAATIYGASGIRIDNTGNLYIAESEVYRIRKVSSSGIISTIAGNGFNGYTGNGGPATAASINPIDVMYDNFGNIFICEEGNSTVRKVSSSGIITTIAGTGVGGYNGDGDPATSYELYDPYGIAHDSCDNIYIADNANNRIRKITYPYCNYLSVNEVITHKDISLFPNPTTATLTITSPQNITNTIITNLVGQVVYTHLYNAPQIEVNVADLPLGIYFVKVQFGGAHYDNYTEVRKFVKE